MEEKRELKKTAKGKPVAAQAGRKTDSPKRTAGRKAGSRKKTGKTADSGRKKPVEKTGNGEKQVWKPGTMLYPLPAVMVSCADREGHTNIITVAWTGTVCSDPAMVYVSVRPERHSYRMIQESGEFVINLTSEALCAATDYCGVRSGAKVNKWAECGLTEQKASKLSYAPLIRESPVNLECRVTKVLPLGTHDMFLAEVLAVNVDERCIDATGKFDLNRAGLVAYSHGGYFGLGEQLGSFGYTVRKKQQKNEKRPPAKK